MNVRAQLVELDVPLPAGMQRRHVGVLLRVPAEQASLLGQALFGALELELRDPAAPAPTDGPMTMTRADVQRELGVSLTTLDRMRRERPDFPPEFRVTRPGHAQGVPRWDAVQVRAFKAKLQQETVASRAQRAERAHRLKRMSLRAVGRHA